MIRRREREAGGSAKRRREAGGSRGVEKRSTSTGGIDHPGELEKSAFEFSNSESFGEENRAA